MQSVDRSRLFVGSCAAIATLAFTFAALSGVLLQLKSEFLLDNVQVGLIGGAGLWGMAISQVGFSSLTDIVGMRNLLRIACAGHVGGIIIFLTAGSFTGLFAGALVTAGANGVVEAVCNPLVATLFPERKAGMLNRLHLWFPAGIVLGGLAIWGIDLLDGSWRWKMLIPLAPMAVYAAILLRATFPATEAAQHGHRLTDAFRAVASTPLLWLFLGLMAVTMSLELGPNRWIPAVLQAGGFPGILVLVMINGVMAVTRANAHGILLRITPPTLLCICTGVAGLGLLWLSKAEGAVPTVAAAFVFAIGISVVWPTMMGFVAERAPNTGALGLGLMAATGSIAVGLITTPLLGAIADRHLPDGLDAAQVMRVARIVRSTPDPRLRADALAYLRADATPDVTGDLLRRVVAGKAGPAMAAEAAPMLAAAENRSGLLSFRFLVPFAAAVSLIFGLVAMADRKSGGYAAQVAKARLTRKVSS